MTGGAAAGGAPRYAAKPDPGSSHAWAVAEARRLAPGPLRILDVGAAQGAVLALVRAARAGPGGGPVEAWAVEPGPDAAVLGAVADRVLARVEDAPLPGDARPDLGAWAGFDLALLLDVLEHAPAPEALLAEVVRRVRPGGTLLVSVPNVAHWSVRALLLAGRFDYAERGILDRTHLRFFTRRTLGHLLAGAGLAVEAEAASVVPLELVLPRPVTRTAAWRALRAVRRAAAGAWPGPLAFQLLARCRRPG